MSLYAYVSGNPLKYWDPFGLACSKPGVPWWETLAQLQGAVGQRFGEFFGEVGSNLREAKDGATDVIGNVAFSAAYSFGVIDSETLAENAPLVMGVGAGIEASGGVGQFALEAGVQTGRNAVDTLGRAAQGDIEALADLATFEAGLLLGGGANTVNRARGVSVTVGKAASGGAGGAPTRVLHFTDDVGSEAISNSGNLRQGTFVTLPQEVPVGSSASQVERLLEIAPGRGRNFIDRFVNPKDLVIPGSQHGGPFTSGGVRQFQLRRELSIDPTRFGKTEP